MRQSKFLKNKDSFTLVELLVVIGILAILTAAVVIVLNPAELLKQSRDSKRTTDLANLNNAIKLLLTQNPDVSLGTASTVYVSLADSSSTCGSYALPALPSGWKYQCATSANYQKTDANGWVPVNFAAANTVASLPTLPVDPQNSGAYYYGYIPGGSWEVMGLFESEKYSEKARLDAGIDPERLEMGSNIGLWKDPYGLVGYWPFDEGSGTAARDMSGNNNTGTLTNGPAWQSGPNCKLGSCLSFDGSNDYVLVADSPTLNFGTGDFTMMFYISGQYDLNSNYRRVISKSSWPCLEIYFYSGNNFGTQLGDCTNSTMYGYPKSNILTNSFNFYSVVKTSSKIYLYANGNLISTQTIGTNYNVSNNRPLTIGGVGSEIFLGTLDDVRIYNRALTAAEIQSIYNATK